jgi:hypothetical protein
LQTNKQINIESNTIWTTVSGVLGATTTWADNARIHVTGNLTVPNGAVLNIGAGTTVRLNPGVNITNSGRTIINGTTLQPVVFTATNRVAPELRTGAWGGWIMRGTSAELIANGAIMTGSGAAAGFSFSPGSSHRSEQPLLFVHSGATVRMTNCFLINNAGQVGNGYLSSFIWDHCLLQRAITCGEYDGCTNIVNHSAVIEFPSVDGVYNATIADCRLRRVLHDSRHELSRQQPLLALPRTMRSTRALVARALLSSPTVGLNLRCTKRSHGRVRVGKRGLTTQL